MQYRILSHGICDGNITIMPISPAAGHKNWRLAPLHKPASQGQTFFAFIVWVAIGIHQIGQNYDGVIHAFLASLKKLLERQFLTKGIPQEALAFA
jgi:hypothetical protein